MNKNLQIAFDLNDSNIIKYLNYIYEHRINSLENTPNADTALHHIVPTSWFKRNNIEADNSSSNTARLTLKDHCIAHILLAQYYINRDKKSERSMMFGMCMAVIRMLAKNCSTCPPIEKLTADEIEFLAINYQASMKVVQEQWNNLIWITNGKEDKRQYKDDLIPEGWRKGRSFAGKQIRITNGVEVKLLDKDAPIPEGWIHGTIYKPCQNKIWINNGSQNRRILKSKQIPKGWVKGQISKNRIVSDSFKLSSKDKLLISNGSEAKYINKNDPLPERWHYGRKDSDLGKASYNRDKIWITNGKENLYIGQNDLIPYGWHLGLTQRKTKPRPRKMWITDGNITMQVDYNDTIPNGFKRGRSDLHN